MTRLFRELPKALAGEEEPLHQMRVTGRRLRTALPILAERPRGGRVKRTSRLLRDLVRTGGTSRDLDVSCAIFTEQLKEADTPISPTLKTLKTRLRVARNRSRAKMADSLLDLDIARLRRELRRILAQKGESRFVFLQRLRQLRDERSDELLRRLDEIGDRFDAESLHRLRILCRKLRYILEIADEIKGVTSPAPVVFKELQGQLGKIHDTYVLAQWFAGEATRAASRGNSEREVEAARQEAAFLERSRRHHLDFLSKDPKRRVREALAIAPPPPGTAVLQPVVRSPSA